MESVNVALSSEENQTKELEKFISTLPQQSSWKFSENLFKYQGFWLYPDYLTRIILFQKHYTPQPTDILLCTIPKSGTTWLKALSFAIVTRTRYTDSNSNSPANPLLTKLSHEIVPFLDFNFFVGYSRDPENPLICTHVPFTSLPESFLNSNCKIIYLSRDPKDVLVSLWQFTNKNFSEKVVPFQEAYEKFCNGFSIYGPYWDHVLGYWKASLDFPEKVLFLKYEDLKKDPCFYVKQMADFMGYPFSEEEEKQGMVEKVVELCSFENLSNLEVIKSKDKSSRVFEGVDNSAFFRKGKPGDWKNHMTDEMAERLDKIIHQHFEGSGLYM